jgi:hypothetical protein
MGAIVRAFAIIHTMVVEYLCDSYCGTCYVEGDGDERETISNQVQMIRALAGRTASASFWHKHLQAIEAFEVDIQLKSTLADYNSESGVLQYHAISRSQHGDVSESSREDSIGTTQLVIERIE